MAWSIEKSKVIMDEARRYIPGGVNSPVRSFRAVGGNPPVIARGEGSRIWDIDGNSYVDYVLSWGPLILGHAHPEVAAALKAAVDRGTSYGAPTELELELAKMVTEVVPSMEMVRMVNSGTEATMSAIRVARGATKRNKVIKFIGCYHGHNDGLLVRAGSGALTLGVPDSPGVPEGIASNTLSLPFNDLEAVEEAFRRYGEDIACIILEPVVGNMGLVLPKPDYLEGLRRVTLEYGALLIFDEVMTGFRVAYGGAQGRWNIDPDLTTLGKVIGGGLPVGAYGGKRQYMELVAPAGPIYQAGTLSGNPLAMTAGIETLKILRRPGAYETLERQTRRLVDGLAENLRRLEMNYRPQSIGSMWGLFFTEAEVTDFESALTSDTKKFNAYFGSMLEQGFYLAPSQFEAGFMSLAHSDEDIDRTVEGAYQAFRKAKETR